MTVDVTLDEEEGKREGMRWGACVVQIQCRQPSCVPDERR